MLWRCLRNRCSDLHEAEDALQETLLRAARYRSSLANPARLQAWTLRIAGNVLNDALRRRVSTSGSETEIVERQGDERAEDSSDEEEPMLRIGRYCVPRSTALRMLRTALEHLGRSERVLLGEFYGAHFASAGEAGDGPTSRVASNPGKVYQGGASSCRRIALGQGLSPALVKMRLFRARRRLAAVMRRQVALEGHRLTCLGIED